jgi:hypothetical protein
MKIVLSTIATLAIAFNAPASLPVLADGATEKFDQILTSIAPAPIEGFWVQTDGKESLVKNGAPSLGTIEDRGSIAAIPGRNAYFVVSPDGKIYARGDASLLCEGKLSNCSGFLYYPSQRSMIVAAASTPTGNGLWTVSQDGKVWTAGDAVSYGDAHRDIPIATGIVGTPSGKGYYIVKDDGGVFSFGDAQFFGSTGGKRPGGHHLTGMALSIGHDGKVNGYWLIAANGAVYTFGQAPFWGNAGITNWKVTSIVSFPAQVPGQPPQRTRGYAWVFKNGEVRAVYDPS